MFFKTSVQASALRGAFPNQPNLLSSRTAVVIATERDQPVPRPSLYLEGPDLPNRRKRWAQCLSLPLNGNTVL